MALRTVQLRRSNSTEWAAFNPILKDGEPGLDPVAGVLKFGDGITPWADLPVYAAAVDQSGSGGSVTVDWSDISNVPALFPPDEHTHVVADVTDFTEALQDAVSTLIVAGANVTTTYDDTAGTLTIAAAAGGGGTGLDAEGVRDTIGAALQGAGLITVTVNDPGDTITVSTTATANSSDATLLNRANHTGTQGSATISDFNEAAMDAVAAMLAGGTLISLSYNDTGDVLTVSTTATVNDTDANLKNRANHTGTQLSTTISDFAEAVQDVVGAFAAAGSGIALVYNDPSNTFTISQGPRSQSSQAGAYTFALADASTVVEGSSATAQTFTVPPNSSVAFPVGSEIEVVAMGAGQITAAPGAGVTLRSRGGALKTNGQYAVMSLRKRATDEWVVTGDVTT